MHIHSAVAAGPHPGQLRPSAGAHSGPSGDETPGNVAGHCTHEQGPHSGQCRRLSILSFGLLSKDVSRHQMFDIVSNYNKCYIW